jgi:tRNA threonylcarbamoyl adenosine modification protein YeaZ
MREYNIAAMVILALETATHAGSFALFADGVVTRASIGEGARTHGARLPEALREFVAGAGRTLRDVEIFVVVTGPGSFTGLRVGIATIQGLALASARPVIGVPTLDAMASGWLDGHPGEADTIAACLDGSREDVFHAVYDARKSPRSLVAGVWRSSAMLAIALQACSARRCRPRASTGHFRIWPRRPSGSRQAGSAPRQSLTRCGPCMCAARMRCWRASVNSGARASSSR